MNCYSENPKQSLKCAKEVQQFSECVDLTRLVSAGNIVGICSRQYLMLLLYFNLLLRKLSIFVIETVFHSVLLHSMCTEYARNMTMQTK